MCIRDRYIRLYLEKTYGLTSEKKIADAADLAADANKMCIRDRSIRAALAHSRILFSTRL